MDRVSIAGVFQRRVQEKNRPFKSAKKKKKTPATHNGLRDQKPLRTGRGAGYWGKTNAFARKRRGAKKSGQRTL